MRGEECVVGDKDKSASLVEDKMALMIDRISNSNNDSKIKREDNKSRTTTTNKTSKYREPRKGVAEELQTWRDKCSVKDAKFMARQGVPTYSAGVFCSGGCLGRNGWTSPALSCPSGTLP
jgi:hypothetical protein